MRASDMWRCGHWSEIDLVIPDRLDPDPLDSVN